jgi:hypothetical protein
MSLKAFHVVFITAATALAVGCGIWAFKDYFSADGRAWDLVFGVGCIAAAVGLVFYERYFLKKLKNISYL